MKKLIIWGTTSQAIVLNEFVNLIGYKLIAFFDDDPNAKSLSSKIPIYFGIQGFNDWWSNITNKKDIYFAVAIGGDKGKDRKRIQNFLEHQGLNVTTMIHSSAFVASNAHIGKGSQILAQSSVCAKVKLSQACIVNTSASIDHECIIGKGVHVGPGANLGGCVTIGDYSFIGMGSVLLPNVNIGHSTTIGAGSVVTKNIPNNVVCYGNPAKIMHRKNLVNSQKIQL